MIHAWLMKRALFGLKKWIWLLIVAGLIAALFLWFHLAEQADDKANQEIGATTERNIQLETTLERTNQGNQAREEIRNDVGDARYAQCLRTARTPENCIRFLFEQ